MKRSKIIQGGFNYRQRLFENNRYERKKLKILLSLVPQVGKVLEVGCGYGFFSWLMLSRGRKVFATDIVKGVAKKPLSEGVVFKRIQKNQFPFRKNSFDGLVSIDVLEHVENDVDFVKKCWRVLRKRGKIIVVTPNIYRLSFWLKSLVFKKPRFPDQGQPDPIFGTDRHLREYNRKKLRALFEKEKWRNKKIFGYGFGLSHDYSISGLMPSPLNFFSNYLIVVAEKY